MSGMEENKQLTRTFYDEVVAKGRVELLDTLAAPDMVDHAAEVMGWKPGRDGFVQHIEWLHGAVSSVNVTVDDLLAEADRVVAYWTLQGTHVGEFFGVPATGREFTATAVSRLSFVNGQIVDYLVRPDALGILQQLGALPS
jgi:predicted ester cyclase